MDANQLLGIKKMVRGVLGLPDVAQLQDFSVSTMAGTLKVEAKIRMDISLHTQPETALMSPVNKYKPAVKALKKGKKRNVNACMTAVYRANPGDFKAMRNLLGKWRREGLMSTPEVQEMGEFAGKFFITMTEEERGGLIRFFNKIRSAVTERMAAKKEAPAEQDQDEHEESPEMAEAGV